MHIITQRTRLEPGALLYYHKSDGSVRKVIVVRDTGEPPMTVRYEFEKLHMRVDPKRLREPSKCIRGLVDAMLTTRDLPEATQLARIRQLLDDVEALKN